MKDSSFWLARELSKSVTMCRCLRKAQFACLADCLTGVQWEQLALLFIDQDEILAQNAKGQFFPRNILNVEVSLLEAVREQLLKVPVLQCPILKREITAYQGRVTFTWQMVLVAQDVILIKKKKLQVSFYWTFFVSVALSTEENVQVFLVWFSVDLPS